MPWQVFAELGRNDFRAVDKDYVPVNRSESLPAEFPSVEEAQRFVEDCPKVGPIHNVRIVERMGLDEAHRVLVSTPDYEVGQSTRAAASYQLEHDFGSPEWTGREEIKSAVYAVLGIYPDPRR